MCSDRVKQVPLGAGCVYPLSDRPLPVSNADDNDALALAVDDGLHKEVPANAGTLDNGVTDVQSSRRRIYCDLLDQVENRFLRFKIKSEPLAQGVRREPWHEAHREVPWLV